MRIAIGSDHRGYALKEALKAYLEKRGDTVADFGTHSEDSADYPDFGRPVAEAVAAGNADFGVTICWTGNGMNIVANKVTGVRAAIAFDTDLAQLARAHNDANVLTLAAKYVDADTAARIVDVFLTTQFEGGRHLSRVDKIRAVEASGSTV
ncbi:MAG TPA: ribose 5-phosphate isomerase B [Acidobacteriota bacterium]|nr:ribose 5-phosphate isomerase B [Acidobacteriota bacterium]